MLLTIDDIDTFREVRGHAATSVTRSVLDTVRNLDEREELEPFIRAILADPSDTPHGPAEIADILTHKLTVRRESGLAAFILKGRSFPTVRPKHVSTKSIESKKSLISASRHLERQESYSTPRKSNSVRPHRDWAVITSCWMPSILVASSSRTDSCVRETGTKFTRAAVAAATPPPIGCSTFSKKPP